MGVVQINTDPTRKQLNQFGFIWLGFLAFFGAVFYLKFGNPTVAKALWVLAFVVPIIGWLMPAFMRLVFVGMSYLAWPIGFVVSHVVLAIVYYVVITPLGVVMRLFGYDPMKRRFDPSTETYWVERDGEGAEPKRYFRQF